VAIIPNLGGGDGGGSGSQGLGLRLSKIDIKNSQSHSPLVAHIVLETSGN